MRDTHAGALIRRLIRDHVARYWPWLLAAIGCMTVAAASVAANAWLMKPVIDDVFTDKNAFMLIVVPLAVIAVAVANGFATYGQATLMNFTGQRIIADLQQRLYQHLMRADLAFFHSTTTGTLISHFTNDTQMLRGAVSTVLTGIAKDALTLVFLIALMIYRDPLMSLVALVAFPLAILPIRRLGRRMRKVSTQTQEQLGDFTTLLGQTLQGVRHVKAYTMEEAETRRANATIDRVFGLWFKAARTRALVPPIMEFLGSLAIALVIWYGGARVIAGETTAGTFFSFITALLLAYQPVKNLANLNVALQEGLAAATRLFAVLDREPTIRDRPDAKPLRLSAGHIRFEGVVFAYHADAPALVGVDLDVPAGKTVALVGPSGSGKSTILNLLPRFYDVDAGRIIIDGQDIREVTLHSLRRNMALVSQEVALFDDTVRANIAYGKFDATEDEIVAAARRAAAHDFIMELPDGYDTRVGEHGVKLSGGQRQRLSIARAMVKDAPILLLDEATSALDTESERLVQQGLQELVRGRTTLMIAHRLSTIQQADAICVIDGGRVVERGTHAELLAEGRAYARLHSLQFADDAAPDPMRRA